MNRIYLFFISFMCLLIAGSAEASIKADISAFSSRVVTTVQDTVITVQTKIDTAAKKFQESQIGSAIKSTVETVKALKEDVTKAANTVKAEYQETVDNANAIKDAAVDAYEEEKEKFENSKAGQLTELSKELDDVNKQLEDRTTVLSQELSAKKEAAQSNLVNMQKMYEQTDDEESKAQLSQEMSALEQQIAQYEADAKQIEEAGSDYLKSDEEYNELFSKQAELAAQIAELSANTVADAADSLINAFNQTDAERSAKYNEVIEENFLGPQEPETAENVSRIIKHRQEVLVKDTANAFYAAATLKLALDEDLERIKRKQRNMSAVDYKITAANLLIEQKIEDIKILYNYTNLMVADLRLKTSRNMFNQDYRLKNYDKDPAVLDLDNYIFTKDDVPSDEGEKSFLDSVTGE